ncbi:rifin [Plasmodium reichenowi]|uniref:Rifin n=1 Tax=Plasmodium reichenowi TaxID=5854 RepID=A0A060RQ63_PLARE|nr:rifin [Plasmodium reichenowi]
MKLHYSKILLFVLPLNILAHNNKNKLYITPHHTPIYTSRMLSECYIQSSLYNNDADMKSVKEHFDLQTSQRFEEYEERMKDKRQKHKEQRDRNIQKIIEKGKMEKSLSEKIEKGCFRCGCGLGGVAASVAVFGGLGIYGSKTAAIAAATDAAIAEVAAAGEAAHIPEIIKEVIAGLEEIGVSIQGVPRLQSLFTPNTYPSASEIAHAINRQYDASSCIIGGPGARETFCSWVREIFGTAEKIPGKVNLASESIKMGVENIISNAKTVATKKVTATLTEQKTSEIAAACMGHQTAIIASVVALLIIALVMIIIYLVLRYRRKKKMNKKAQYTKLLNQ